MDFLNGRHINQEIRHTTNGQCVIESRPRVQKSRNVGERLGQKWLDQPLSCE